MTISLKHAFQSAVADGGDTSLVQPSNWNAEHTLTLASGTLLGRTTASTGAAEEITAGTGLSLSSLTLSLANTSVAAGTYGSATEVGTFTVDAQGRITGAANTTVTPAVGSITGLGTGVATFLATPSSANLAAAVTDETGSGSLVFGTSPTLSGPTISGNLTFSGTGNRITGDFSNATVANRVAFQTSTTNGNTSVIAIPNGTSTQSQFLAFANSDVTNASLGRLLVNATEVQFTADRTGTGTYLPTVFYTGGSERVRIDTSGNVGIGTSSLGTILDIVTSTAGDGSRITGYNGTSTSGPAMSIRSARGTAASPTALVSGDRIGGIFFNGHDGAGFTVGLSTIFGEVDGTVSTGSVPSRLSFWTTPSGSTTRAERMRIDASGNVGIGVVPSGSHNLEVYGTSRGNIMSRGATDRGQLNTQTGAADAAGLVVGVVQFYGGASTSGSAEPRSAGVFAGTEGATANDRGGYLAFSTKINGAGLTERMRIDASGNVAIGSASAGAKLDVQSAGGLAIRVYNNTSTADASFTATNTAGSGLFGISSSAAYVYSSNMPVQLNSGYASGYVLFSTNNTERMRVGPSGQIGIGGANYGTSGQVLTSNGSAAAPTWSSASSMTLLGTVSTTSGTNPTISGLTLTGYKQLQLVFQGVSHNSTGNSRQVLVGTSTADDVNVTGGFIDTATIRGFVWIDLVNGTFASDVADAGASASNTSSVLAGDLAITTASTAISFALSATGSFDAGSVLVYGVS